MQYSLYCDGHYIRSYVEKEKAIKDAKMLENIDARSKPNVLVFEESRKFVYAKGKEIDENVE